MLQQLKRMPTLYPWSFSPIESAFKYKFVNILGAVVLLMVSLHSAAAQNQANEPTDTFIRKCKTYFNNPDSLRFYGNKLLLQSGTEAQFEGWFALGYRYEFLLQLDSAVFCFNKAKGLIKNDQGLNKSFYFRIATRLSQAQGRRNELDSSLMVMDELLLSGILDSGTVPWARTIKSKGLILRLLSKEQESIEALLLALPILLEAGDREAPNTMTSIALNYLQLGQDSIGKHWLHKCRVAAWKYGDESGKARALNNLGNYHIDRLNADSAQYYFSWLLKNRLPIHRETLSYVYQNLSKVYWQQEQVVISNLYLDSALQLIDTSTASLRSIELIEYLANHKLKQNSISEALFYINRALAKNKNTLDVHRRLTLLMAKSAMLEKDGQLEQSLAILRSYQKSKDSLQYDLDVEKIHGVISQFELSEKINHVKREINKKWGVNVAIIVLSLLIPLLVIVFVLKNKRVSLRAMEKELLLTKQQMAEQMNDIEAPPILELTGNIKVPVDELLYAEKQERYLLLTLSGGKTQRVRMSLKALTDGSPSTLIQIHRSYIIHWQQVRQVNYDSIKMKNGQILPFGRSFRLKLLEEKHSLMKDFNQ